jgi:hypothetical protein
MGEMQIDLLLESLVYSEKTRRDLDTFIQESLDGKHAHARGVLALVVSRLSARYALRCDPQKSDKEKYHISSSSETIFITLKFFVCVFFLFLISDLLVL